MEGIEGRAGLLFLKKLAERYPDRVLVLPFIWKEGFASVSAAAAFGLVCSFYEPGGLSSEFIANATPIVCSATGGSVMQVAPWRAAATMHQGVQVKCDRWHARSAPPTGIVYDARQHTLAGWQAINAGGYSVGGEPDIVQHREGIPLFNDLAGELALAMTEAIRLYHDAPQLYYEMAANGVIHFERNFSWLKAGAEYARQLAS
jgi:glycosyltransferase involved in cell wall biosynthesis